MKDTSSDTRNDTSNEMVNNLEITVALLLFIISKSIFCHRLSIIITQQ